MQYESPIKSDEKVMTKVKFFKIGQTSRSRSQGQKLRYHVKGLVTRNTHVQYESPITSGNEVMAKVKVFVHATDVDADAHSHADGRAVTLDQIKKYVCFLLHSLKLLGRSVGISFFFFFFFFLEL